MKDTIFISHANPENNYFAAWLAGKLKLLGYKVWVDVRNIKPGEYFNIDFEKKIREESIRFLAIASSDWLLKSTTPDTGVMNELQIARTIRDIEGFIIPIRYDNSPFSEFPTGIIGRQAISFNENWADGLNTLIKHFEDVGVPKEQTQNSILQFWYESQKIKSDTLEKVEKYYTNWFAADLPEYIYIHRPNYFSKNEILSLPFTKVIESDRFISFISEQAVGNAVNLQSTVKLKTEQLFSNEDFILDDGFVLHAPGKKVVALVNRLFRSFLLQKKLKVYPQSSKKEIFYFLRSAENIKSVNLKQLGKTRRTILGTTADFIWHFAISFQASLYPIPCLKIYYHLVFTDLQGKLLESTEQHVLRRSMPSDWYNRKWLETMLAMMLKISGFDIDNLIKVKIDANTELKVHVLPIDIISSFGYNEPRDELETGIL